MMKIDVSKLSAENARAVSGLSELMNFSVGDGICVEAIESSENKCEKIGASYKIFYKTRSYIFRGMKNLIERDNKDFTIVENCFFDNLGVMADCSRNAVLKVSGVKKLIRVIASLGFNTMQLYTEDIYEVEDEPYFGYMRGKYTQNELKELDDYAFMYGIELIPCIQTLAHLNGCMRWYADINDINDIILADEDRTYQLVERMFSSMSKGLRSRNINIGMDEAHMLGLGKYLDKHGYTTRPQIMLKHLARVNDIAHKYGYKCSMWSDMFFRMAFGGNYDAQGEISQEVLAQVPSDITLIYWDYYSTDKARYDKMLSSHLKFNNKIAFAGGAWTWMGFAPMNGYSLNATEAAFSSCAEHGIKDAFITMWGDNGGECSPFKAIPALTFAAEKAYGHTLSDAKTAIKAISQMSFEDFSSLDLPNVTNEKTDCLRCSQSKYMLYSDCLFGLLDSTVTEGEGEIYQSHASVLKKLSRNKQWGYLFAPLGKLCEVLYLKYDLGVVTRRLYAEKNREQLAALVVERYRPLVKKIENFYESFLQYWNTDDKPNGFEVQDARIGGLVLRVKHISQIIADYASGKTDKIVELDEDLLDFQGGGKIMKKGAVGYNAYGFCVSVNTL